ncbi:MAG: leucine-rich repeat domain-containing protein, partial [Paludibacteraceae bacterium]|nr:leucine-rich repeat domain-containing protein [Paludibacteraceae bacterium]
LKNISKWAFCNCTELEEVVIPETVETVEKHAFTDCISLHNLTLPKLVMTIEAEALTGVPDVKLSNLCTVTDGYFDLDAPLSFENSKGKLYSRKSTSELALYGIDTDESRQRYDLLNHWFGKVKPALKQSGFSFFYWNYADNTFAVRINDKIDVVFNTSTLLDAENVSGFINTLANNINNSNLGFKIVDEIVTAKVQKAAKAQKKSGPFVMVVSDEEKNATAKADKVVMMNELFFKGQMDEYLEKNADVTITVCNVDMNVDLGINYHDCFKFMIKVTTSSVEDGSAVAAVDSLLKEMDQYNVRCKLV